MVKHLSIVLPSSETLLFNRPKTQEHLNGRICDLNALYLIIQLIVCMPCWISSNCVVAGILSAFFISFSSVSLLIFLLPPPTRSCDRQCLFVCQQNSVMSCGEYLMKFWENVVNGPRTIPLNVGDVLNFRDLSKIKGCWLWSLMFCGGLRALWMLFSSFYLGWNLKSRSYIASDC